MSHQTATIWCQIANNSKDNVLKYIGFSPAKESQNNPDEYKRAKLKKSDWKRG